MDCSATPAFKTRIQNWSRVFRDYPRHGIAPTALALRALSEPRGDADQRPKADFGDAAILDRVFLKLPRLQQSLLRAAYLNRHSRPECGGTEDFQRALQYAARQVAGGMRVCDFLACLGRAEWIFERAVVDAEEIAAMRGVNLRELYK